MVDVETAFRRYFPLIREKCRRMLSDFAEADDVAQRQAQSGARQHDPGLWPDQPCPEPLKDRRIVGGQRAF